MDFKQLMQTMQQIEEGAELRVEECGDMPAIIQGGPPPEESLNMNLTINSKGADGIRELIDVLKGIGGDSDTEPKDMPHDDDSEIVIGDNYENEVEGDAGPKVFGIDSLLHQGDKKDRETNKVNGGGNPQLSETLVQNLFSLYEEIKDRRTMPIKEDKAAIDAWLANPSNRIKHGKTKKTKSDKIAGRIPGEHESGTIKSADAISAPKRATRHDHIDFKAEPERDYNDVLDALAALKDTDWKAIDDKERKHKEEVARRIEHEKWLKRRRNYERMKNTKWTPTKLQDK